MAREQCQDCEPRCVDADLQFYSPGLLASCEHAAKRAREIVTGALEKYMLSDTDDPAQGARDAADWFGNAAEFLSHGRPVRRDEAREHGIVVNDLEDDDDLQDLVLSVHHTAMLTLSHTGTVKLVESHRGRAWVQQVQQQVVALQQPGQQVAKQRPQLPQRKAPPQPPRKRRRGK